MTKRKQVRKVDKTSLHTRSRHRHAYDFGQLIQHEPLLENHVHMNAYGNMSIDFFDPLAVKALNKALLLAHYGLAYWDIPDGYLCPAVPGRADYVHYLADLLLSGHSSTKFPHAHCLDIGTGANCIYPIIGVCQYEWTFVGTDIDKVALQSAEKIISSNPQLVGRIECKHQDNPSSLFAGIMNDDDYFDICMCNPPFHASQAEAHKAAAMKLKKLGKAADGVVLNFGGQKNELWCAGGEVAFIKRMIEESTICSTSCFWFTTLVSKKENIEILEKELNLTYATKVKVISMAQGQKSSRILAWTFLSEKQQKVWTASRWR